MPQIASLPSKPLLVLNQLGKTRTTFGDTNAILCGISLSIAEGEFCSITGPSGCGKTTLLQLIGLLDSPSSGSYHLDGQSVELASPTERARIRNQKIGFVFQSFYLLPALSALDNVAMPLVYRGIQRKQARQEAAAALEKVGLAERLAHAPHQLSGGQQQRVAIARALIGNPRLLLADEPTGNLDDNTSEDIIGIFEHLNHTAKTTIVMVTHDQHMAARSTRRLHFEGRQLLELR
jgi:putative ABC transport system ATP-binding protein